MPVPHTIARSPHGAFLRSPHGVLDRAIGAPSPPIVGDVLFAMHDQFVPPQERRAQLAGIFGAPAVTFRNPFGNPLHQLPRMQPEDFLQFGLIFNLSGGLGADLFTSFLPGMRSIGWKGRIEWWALSWGRGPSSLTVSSQPGFVPFSRFFDFTDIHGIGVNQFQPRDAPESSGNISDTTGHPLAGGASGIPLDIGNPDADIATVTILSSFSGGSPVFTKAGEAITVERVVDGIEFVGSYYGPDMLTGTGVGASTIPSSGPLSRYFHNLYTVPVG